MEQFLLPLSVTSCSVYACAAQRCQQKIQDTDGCWSCPIPLWLKEYVNDAVKIRFGDKPDLFIPVFINIIFLSVFINDPVSFVICQRQRDRTLCILRFTSETPAESLFFYNFDGNIICFNIFNEIFRVWLVSQPVVNEYFSDFDVIGVQKQTSLGIALKVIFFVCSVSYSIVPW